ncbi:hypothetical protein E1301_Tti020600 [Triplophysa tibetana]|uniref:ADM Adrenomedullin n=1 Tax=Triplophysa tibetana TaxID=1572043 RepID=A0A5A9NZG5_9TELE|nr:hypothetical protein E1301_Tti020600 [Triplophysa tibetana]
MNSVLQSALFCCVLTTLLPKITSATPLNAEDLRRLSDWLQGEVWRDVGSEGDSTPPPSEQENAGTELYEPQHRSLRAKRTEPAYSVKRIERAGCNLATCSVHELAHLLNIMRTKTNSAPLDKIGSKGYGRRRRRSLQPAHPAQTFDGLHPKLAWLHTLKRCVLCCRNEGTTEDTTSTYTTCQPMTEEETEKQQQEDKRTKSEGHNLVIMEDQ